MFDGAFVQHRISAAGARFFRPRPLILGRASCDPYFFQTALNPGRPRTLFSAVMAQA